MKAACGCIFERCLDIRIRIHVHISVPGSRNLTGLILWQSLEIREICPMGTLAGDLMAVGFQDVLHVAIQPAHSIYDPVRGGYWVTINLAGPEPARWRLSASSTWRGAGVSGSVAPIRSTTS